MVGGIKKDNGGKEERMKYRNTWANLFGVLIAVILICVSSTGCKQPIISEEQAAKIEKLSTLVPCDMVMIKDGSIYMVDEPLDHKGEMKANWVLVLRQANSSPGSQWRRPLLSFYTEEPIVGIYHQDDPLWAKAALCYLNGMNCEDSLKQ